MGNNRVAYIDGIRGLAMLFVVYGHINYFAFRITPFIYQITEAIQMPLFFFISGYVTFLKKDSISLKIVFKSLWNKFSYIVIPTIIMGGLYTLFVLDKSVSEFIFEQMKYGYWFPISLFTMFVIYEFVKYVSKDAIKTLILLIIIAIVLWCLKYILINNIIFITLNSTISLWQTLTHFPFFVLGVILCMVRKYYECVISDKGWFNTVLLTLLISAFFLSSIDLPDIKFPLGGILNLMIGASGSMLILNFFIKYKIYWTNCLIGQSLQTIGRRTLEIYLLHYFLLPDLMYAAEYVNTSSTIIGLAISMAISILIIIFSLIIGNIIRLSPVLAFLLLGVKTKNN